MRTCVNTNSIQRVCVHSIALSRSNNEGDYQDVFYGLGLYNNDYHMTLKQVAKMLLKSSLDKWGASALFLVLTALLNG